MEGCVLFSYYLFVKWEKRRDKDYESWPLVFTLCLTSLPLNLLSCALPPHSQTEFLRTNPDLGEEPIDIEDLVNIGRSCGP